MLEIKQTLGKIHKEVIIHIFLSGLESYFIFTEVLLYGAKGNF